MPESVQSRRRAWRLPGQRTKSAAATGSDHSDAAEVVPSDEVSPAQPQRPPTEIGNAGRSGNSYALIAVLATLATTIVLAALGEPTAYVTGIILATTGLVYALDRYNRRNQP
ncbi:hypothetical protein [Dactylosporangium sp. NPDC051541]|uniref:hypothetical protein n=1 Tax=Dactylosporangium sp. NPDC051541 TaxID=3363977 RepID=UPI0037936BA5